MSRRPIAIGGALLSIARQWRKRKTIDVSIQTVEHHMYYYGTA